MKTNTMNTNTPTSNNSKVSLKLTDFVSARENTPMSVNVAVSPSVKCPSQSVPLKVNLETIKANMQNLSPAQKKSVLASSIMRMVLL